MPMNGWGRGRARIGHGDFKCNCEVNGNYDYNCNCNRNCNCNCLPRIYADGADERGFGQVAGLTKGKEIDKTKNQKGGV